MPDQHFSGAEQHGTRLLIGGFDSDCPHRRPLRRLDDRFGVGSVVLLTLDKRLVTAQVRRPGCELAIDFSRQPNRFSI